MQTINPIPRRESLSGVFPPTGEEGNAPREMSSKWRRPNPELPTRMGNTFDNGKLMMFQKEEILDSSRHRGELSYDETKERDGLACPPIVNRSPRFSNVHGNRTVYGTVVCVQSRPDWREGHRAQLVDGVMFTHEASLEFEVRSKFLFSKSTSTSRQPRSCHGVCDHNVFPFTGWKNVVIVRFSVSAV